MFGKFYLIFEKILVKFSSSSLRIVQFLDNLIKTFGIFKIYWNSIRNY